MPANQQSLEERVKHYYRFKEDYDWSRAADTFIGLETLFHRARRRQTLKLAKQIGHQGRYLDVGCGTAMITRFLPPGTVALDLNPRNLQKAEGYAPRAHFILCDAEGRMPLRDEGFDVVVCTEMLEHLIYPLETVREVYRVLKPRGIFLGSVPGRSLVWRLRGLSTSKHAFEEEPYHKHYSREEVITLLASHFRLRTLYSKFLQMNWFFLALKRETL